MAAEGSNHSCHGHEDVVPNKRGPAIIPGDIPLLVCYCGRLTGSATVTLVVLDPSGETYEDAAVLIYLVAHYAAVRGS